MPVELIKYILSVSRITSKHSESYIDDTIAKSCLRLLSDEEEVNHYDLTSELIGALESSENIKHSSMF